MYTYTHQARTHTHTHTLTHTYTHTYTSGGTTNALSVESTNASSQVDARRIVGDVQVRKVKGGTLDAQGQARALVKREERGKLVKETKEMCAKRMRV
jgi:hypothetical protein